MAGRDRHTDRDERIRPRQFFQQTECHLCETEGLCNAKDGLVACQQCQIELLPSGWAL